uniref:AP complex mu/sigma subunit domain-containing protein n=1 Tax=Phaeomonas parva TaxID=124430 RepID=A0A6U4FEH3_9STRA|mmetsp:Transcript_25123/g.78844  ORF Transcript_25123/g.78844 Transcript_25123/m.78844 type:complete len:217 (+) Transcript_25123:282-932(+)
MIKAVIVVNNHGKARLVKFYQNVSGVEEQQNVIRRIFQQVGQRPDSFCNYLEGSIPEWGDDVKLIYRHYATLYFVFAVDKQESDLGILDLIQVFVEALDKCFENVCELDLIFHSDRVHYVLDEIIMGGMVRRCAGGGVAEAWALRRMHASFLLSVPRNSMVSIRAQVLETNIVNILQAINDQHKLHLASNKVQPVTTQAVGRGRPGPQVARPPPGM